MIRIGMIGAGRIGCVHAKNVATEGTCVLSAISDINSANAAALAGKFGADVKTSVEIINDVAIDAVVIASSTDTHCLMNRGNGFDPDGWHKCEITI